MNLYLVQHAEPKSEEEDPKRPLSEKGLADIRRVADFISEHANVRVGSIMHSGKTRAEQTAMILAEYLKPPNGVMQAEGLKPLDAISIMIERLWGMKEDVMLVGHLPHLTKLSSYLLCQDDKKTIVDFKMGGVVCLGSDEAHEWSINWMVIPQII